MTTSCPCGRGGTFGALPYERCCGRYLDDPAVPAPDAESLMRSRYTAYTLGRRDYLLATWDDAHRPHRLDLDPDVTWQGLDVLDHTTDGDRAEVEFVARLSSPAGRGRRPGGRRPQEQRLHERSRFVRRDGRWFYLDAAEHRGPAPAGSGA